jgi:hypothetical protein
MKKSGILIMTILLTPVLAGIYGIIHDQLTYSISYEYYTKFKFIQFELWDGDGEAILTNPRLSVAIVGFMATWWTGIFIGIALGMTGLIHKDYKTMLKNICKSIVVTLIIAFITGLLGLAYGKFYLAKIGVDWFLPLNLVEKGNFIAVGSMHNFSYIGGFIGLIAGIIYQIKLKHKEKLQEQML